MSNLALKPRKVTAALLAFLWLISAVVGILAPPFSSVHAQEDVTVSITGSFYRQNPSIPHGSGIGGPSIYVIVANAGGSDVEIVMVSEAPDGVTVGFDRGTFVLTPQQHQQVQIRVDVADTVPAGEYPSSLRVSADVYRSGIAGAKTSASGAQRTSLTVTGSSANVVVNTVAPSGQPVVSQVRLFRMVGDTGYEVAYSNTGSVSAKVVPGTFTAEAYSVKTGGGKLCDPSTFDVADGEDKTVTLPVRMVYFEDDFVLSPNYDSETGRLLNALTMATLTNVYDTMANTAVKLLVTFNGEPLEEITVLGPLPLPLSQTGVPWSYIPAEGWKSGLYGFRYQLCVDGQLIAETAEQTLVVGGKGMLGSWLWIIFLVLGVLGAAGLGLLIFFLVKRRKKAEEKVGKRTKRKKQEKPEPSETPEPRKPEPIRRPEPVRPVEPARPVRPATVDGPEVQPSRLASVSSLKARMASLGRDQGIGKEVEEGPVTEEQDEPAPPSPVTVASAPVPPARKTKEPERLAAASGEAEVEKPPVVEKPAVHKPGIFSRVSAAGKKEPHGPASVQGSPPVKPEDEVIINWPPRVPEPPKPASDVMVNRPPKPAEAPKPEEPAQPNEAPKLPSDVVIGWLPGPVEVPRPVEAAQPAQAPRRPSGLEQVMHQRMEPRHAPSIPDVTAPLEDAGSDETETDAAPPMPPLRSSFAEAARLRMEARRASEGSKTGASAEESVAEGKDGAGAGETQDSPPSP